MQRVEKSKADRLSAIWPVERLGAGLARTCDAAEEMSDQKAPVFVPKPMWLTNQLSESPRRLYPEQVSAWVNCNDILDGWMSPGSGPNGTFGRPPMYPFTSSLVGEGKKKFGSSSLAFMLILASEAMRPGRDRILTPRKWVVHWAHLGTTEMEVFIVYLNTKQNPAENGTKRTNFTVEFRGGWNNHARLFRPPHSGT